MTRQTLRGPVDVASGSSARTPRSLRAAKLANGSAATSPNPAGPPPVTVRRGIPFALAPTGERRFQPPVPLTDPPVDPLTAPVAPGEPRNAFGPAPMQHVGKHSSLGAGVVTSEDCLTLNIWTPQGADADHPAPVMVWIFGGAYSFGGSSTPAFDGTKLAQEGVVVVSLNYRLGAFGWLDLPGVSTTNNGLRDAMAGLRWVRENIGTFGGDASNVTIFGESAGGVIVLSLVASPAAAGLFDAAIAESAPATSVATREMGALTSRRLLEKLHVSKEELATLPAERILQASTALYKEVPLERPGHLAWTVTVGDDLLADDPVRLLQAGKGNPVPLMIGTNHQEAGTFWLTGSPVLPYRAAGLGGLFAEVIDADPVVELPAVDRDHNHRLAETTHLCFRMPAVWTAEGHSKVAPTYLYRFDYASPALRVAHVGAGHMSEIPYVFGTYASDPIDPTVKLGGRARVEQVSQRLRQRWTSFAKTRVPVSPAGCEWPAFDDVARTALVIDLTDRAVPRLDDKERRIWGEVVLDLVPHPAADLADAGTVPAAADAGSAPAADAGSTPAPVATPGRGSVPAGTQDQPLAAS